MGSRRIVCILAIVSCLGELAAHGGGYPGGQYGGPGDTVPGGGGGRRPGPAGPSGPTTGGPAGPSAPGPSAPAGPTTAGGSGGPGGATTGGPGAPSGSAPRAGMTRRGLVLEDDAATWNHWWEFNKNPFLGRTRADGASVVTGSDDFYLGSSRRTDAIDSLQPTDEQVIRDVLPALRRALEGTDQRDIATGCMVALAKVGRDHPEFRLHDLFAPRLQRADQEVRETAALAFGIGAHGDPASLPLLIALLADDDVGRKARGGAVDDRTRAFAAYAIGLVARGAEASEVKERAFAALRGFVADKALVSRDVKVAAVTAIGLLSPSPRDYRGVQLRTQATALLSDYLERDLGAGEEWVQAHCPTALARLAADGERAAVKERFAKLLLQRTQSLRRGNPTLQSCALALGQTVRGGDADRRDAELCGVLLDVSRDHPDAMTRNFALIALGRIGGSANRTALLREFATASKAQRKPWCAIALGVLAWNDRHRTSPHGATPGGDATIVATLTSALAEAKEPGLVGALAVACGLAGAVDAGDELLDRLRSGANDDTMAGYLCIGLALIGERRAVPDLRDVASHSLRRPTLLTQAAVALGCLGDRSAAEQLVAHMVDRQSNLATMAACATALGRIGDRRSIAPLLQLLGDQAVGDLPRAFAAAALGGVCERGELPWNTPFSVDANYAAAVPTLTDQSSGILDIL